jgi:5-methyltetrahydrofolate--homocysteine methyltransferase
MLKDIVDNDLIEARAIIGIHPANTVDTDDIEVYTNEERTETLCKFFTLR